MIDGFSSVSLGGKVDFDYRGDLVLDIRNYGAFPGSGYAAQTAIAIQNAHDALYNIDQPGYIYVPGGEYFYDRQIFLEGSDIGLKGDGHSSILRAKPGYRGNGILQGVSRTWYTTAGYTVPRPIPEGIRHDLFGILDSTAVSASGQRYGINTSGTYVLTGWANPFCVGPLATGVSYDVAVSDGYDETKQITIDMCYIPLNFPYVSGTTLLHIGDTQNAALGLPFYVFGRTSSATPAITVNIGLCSGVNHSLSPVETTLNTNPSNNITQNAGSTLHHLSLQYDLNTGQFSSFVDAVQSSTFTFSLSSTNARTIRQNNRGPFHIGAFEDNIGQTIAPESTHLLVCGLRFSRGIRYNNLGVGSGQAFVNGDSLTDFNRYFKDDENTIAYLPLTNPPSDTHRFRIEHGQAAGGGYSEGLIVLKNGFCLIANTCEIRDLQIISDSSAYGHCVTYGPLQDGRIYKCKMRGGLHNIGTTAFFANYQGVFYDLNLGDAGEAAIYLDYNLSTFYNIYIDRAFKFGMRGTGSAYSIKGLSINRLTDSTKYALYVEGTDFGGEGVLNHLRVHSSPQTSPTQAWIRFRKAVGFGSGWGYIIIRDVKTPYNAKQVPLVFLPGNSSSDVIGRCRIDGVDGKYSNLILVQDARFWAGKTIINSEDLDDLSKGLIDFISTPNTSDLGRLFIEVDSSQYPPNDLSWVRNTAEILCNSPLRGSVREWKIVRTGTYYSSNPPLLSPLKLYNTEDNNVGGFVKTNIYGTVTIT